MEEKVHIIPFINDQECPLLTYIQVGVKTVEGRKYSKKYQSIRPNDVVVLRVRRWGDLPVRVTYVHRYRTLEEFLEKETIHRTVPCVKTMDEALRIYNVFTDPAEREELRKQYGYGMVAFGIEPLPPDDAKYLKKYLKYKRKYKRAVKN